MIVRPRICVVGSINIDLVVRAPRFPAPGETILGGQFQTFTGGKGANQAVAAARMGADVAMIGRVGDDAYGRALRDVLSREGVDASAVSTRTDAPTGVALITVDADGENTIIVAPGANGLLTPDDLSQHEPSIRSAGLLVMQLETPLATVQRAAQIARAANVPVVLNAAPAVPLAVELLKLTDVLIVNRGEAALLAAMPEQAEAAEIAPRLHARGAGRIVMTLGAQGALMSDEKSVVNQPAFPVDVVDATAAGDAFVGAFAAAIAEGRAAEEALRRAAAAGALACTRAGAMPSLPRLHEVEELSKDG